MVLEKRRLCRATRCPMLCAGTPSPHTALGQHPAGRSAGGALPFEEGKLMCYQGSQSLSDPLNPKDAGLHPNRLHREQPRRGLNRMAGAAVCQRCVWERCLGVTLGPLPTHTLPPAVSFVHRYETMLPPQGRLLSAEPTAALPPLGALLLFPAGRLQVAQPRASAASHPLTCWHPSACQRSAFLSCWRNGCGCARSRSCAWGEPTCRAVTALASAVVQPGSQREPLYINSKVFFSFFS